jgi:hypothetical protein
VDDTHATISKKIVDWSDKIDTTLSGWLGYHESDTTVQKDGNHSVKIERKPLTVDAFFQNLKYFDETESAFIRVRSDSLFDSKNSNDLKLRFSTQIPLSKSKKNFKIFVDELDLDNVNDILKDVEENSQVVSDIGLRYIVPRTYGIRSRYSIGLSGTSPYVKARYNLPANVGEWEIDPIQSFKYSTDDEFEEETNIYFDRSFDDLSLFRVILHRKTETKEDGMDYLIAAQYYWSPKEKTGMKFAQTVYGNTEFEYTVDNTVEPAETRKYGGIHNYVTAVSWRQNIWRDWFYYEITPSVYFHKQHDFEANYAVRVFLDFYFGKYD